MRLQKPERGQPILIPVGEQFLQILFTLRTLKKLDGEHGISVLKGTGMAEAFVDPEKLALLLYYGLLPKQPDVTLEWVEDNFDASMLLGIAPLLAYASTGRWPKLPTDPDDEEENPTTEGTLTTGSPSGRTDDTTSDSLRSSSGT